MREGEGKQDIPPEVLGDVAEELTRIDRANDRVKERAEKTLREALNQYQGDRSQVAQALGVSEQILGLLLDSHSIDYRDYLEDNHADSDFRPQGSYDDLKSENEEVDPDETTPG